MVKRGQCNFHFLCNQDNAFRATAGPVMISDKGAILSKQDAEILGVDVGSDICVTPPSWKLMDDDYKKLAGI